MHFVKSISFDLETAKDLEKWMRKNEQNNLSFSVCHLLKQALGSRNNGVGVSQKKLLVEDVPHIFEEVLEEQGIKKPRYLRTKVIK